MEDISISSGQETRSCTVFDEGRLRIKAFNLIGFQSDPEHLEKHLMDFSLLVGISFPFTFDSLAGVNFALLGAPTILSHCLVPSENQTKAFHVRIGISQIQRHLKKSENAHHRIGSQPHSPDRDAPCGRRAPDRCWKVNVSRVFEAAIVSAQQE